MLELCFFIKDNSLSVPLVMEFIQINFLTHILGKVCTVMYVIELKLGL